MILRIKLKTFLFLATTVFCQQSPSIIYISPDQQKNVGDNIDITCTTQFQNDAAVMWQKVGAFIISSGAGRIIPDTRFSLRHDPGTTTYTLTIKDLQESDSGTYECQIVANKGFSVSKQTQLAVRKRPVITGDTTKDGVYPEGSDVILFCSAAGAPAPSIRWYRQNKAVLPTGGSFYNGNTIKIFHIKKKDRGIYICEATNAAGATTHSINVQVDFKPVAKFSYKGLPAPIGGTVILECFIEGHPAPQSKWSFNSHIISNNEHWSVSDSGMSEMRSSRLRISNVNNDLYGMYQCSVMNPLGSDKQEVLLYNGQSVNASPPVFVNGFTILLIVSVTILTNLFEY